MSTPRWGDEPFRDETVNAASNAYALSFGILSDVLSNISANRDYRREEAANRELKERLVELVLNVDKLCNDRIDNGDVLITRLYDQIDELTDKNFKLEDELKDRLKSLKALYETTPNSQAKLKETEEVKELVERQRNDFRRELSGLQRYKKSVNPRLADYEERQATLLRELNAYREIIRKNHPDIAENITSAVEMAVALPSHYSDAMADLCDKTIEHTSACLSFISTITHENGWGQDEYSKRSSFINECLSYSLKIYDKTERRDLEEARRLIQSARKLHSDKELTRHISEFMPYYGKLITEAEAAWTIENNFRQEKVKELSDLISKSSSVIQTDHSQASSLASARIDAIHAVEKIASVEENLAIMEPRDLVASPSIHANAFAELIKEADILRTAFGGREPFLGAQIRKAVAEAIASLSRTSPHVIAAIESSSRPE